MTARTPDKPERPKTLGRAVHEKYPAAVVEPRDAYRDELTHVDEHGDVRMVDVGEKAVTQRLAIAEGSILMHPETQAMVLEDRAKKGDVLACARIAGIMASKRTSDIIPMCHPLNLTKAKVEIAPITAPGTKLASGWAPERPTVTARTSRTARSWWWTRRPPPWCAVFSPCAPLGKDPAR